MAASGEPRRPSDAVSGAEPESAVEAPTGAGLVVRNGLTGAVSVVVVQAGVVHGGVHVHGRPVVVPPRQLPAVPAAFVGRARALAALDAALDDGASIEQEGRCGSSVMTISAIAGAGGIGKTWPALLSIVPHSCTDVPVAQGVERGATGQPAHRAARAAARPVRAVTTAG